CRATPVSGGPSGVLRLEPRTTPAHGQSRWQSALTNAAPPRGFAESAPVDSACQARAQGFTPAAASRQHLVLEPPERPHGPGFAVQSSTDRARQPPASMVVPVVNVGV